jgi:hypothetical protein
MHWALLFLTVTPTPRTSMQPATSMWSTTAKSSSMRRLPSPFSVAVVSDPV